MFFVLASILITQYAFSQTNGANVKFSDPKNLILKIDTAIFNKKISSN